MRRYATGGLRWQAGRRGVALCLVGMQTRVNATRRSEFRSGRRGATTKGGFEIELQLFNKLGLTNLAKIKLAS